jgi:hypothetical protein
MVFPSLLLLYDYENSLLSWASSQSPIPCAQLHAEAGQRFFLACADSGTMRYSRTLISDGNKHFGFMQELASHRQIRARM